MGTLDVRVAEFWEPGKVDQELRRVYDICAGCRRCLPLCPSFKVMFDRLDAEAVDGDVEKLPPADVKEVVDLCDQCKLCYNHCPYTPPHRHLRAQNMGTKSADVLRAIPGAQVDVIERCSAVDGTWGFKTQYYELSLSVATPLFDAVRATGAATVATDCLLAALQIAQGTGMEPRHPIQILADAYGIDEAP